MSRLRNAPLFATILISFVASSSLLGCDEDPAAFIAPGVALNLVADGGFETPRVVSFEYDSYTAGDTLRAWIISGPIDHLSGRVWTPAEGAQCIDMDGSCGAGTIYEDLATTQSVTYELRFALAGNPNGPPAVKALEVNWNGAPVDTVYFDSTGGSKRNLDWVYYDYTVVATASRTRLTFRSLTPGCYGALLDAVSVRKTPTV